MTAKKPILREALKVPRWHKMRADVATVLSRLLEGGDAAERSQAFDLYERAEEYCHVIHKRENLPVRALSPKEMREVEENEKRDPNNKRDPREYIYRPPKDTAAELQIIRRDAHALLARVQALGQPGIGALMDYAGEHRSLTGSGMVAPTLEAMIDGVYALALAADAAIRSPPRRSNQGRLADARAREICEIAARHYKEISNRDPSHWIRPSHQAKRRYLFSDFVKDLYLATGIGCHRGVAADVKHAVMTWHSSQTG